MKKEKNNMCKINSIFPSPILCPHPSTAPPEPKSVHIQQYNDDEETTTANKGYEKGKGTKIKSFTFLEQGKANKIRKIINFFPSSEEFFLCSEKEKKIDKLQKKVLCTK